MHRNYHLMPLNHISQRSISPPPCHVRYEPTIQPTLKLRNQENKQPQYNNQCYLEQVRDNSVEKIHRTSQLIDIHKENQGAPYKYQQDYKMQMKTLHEELNHFKVEHQKSEQQNANLIQNYNQLVQVYEKQSREHFNLKQAFKQMTQDMHHNEQYKQKLHDHLEQQNSVIKQIQEEQSIIIQTQVLDLEQENHNLRHELSQTSQLMITMSQSSNEDIRRDKLLLQEEQEKLLNLSQELLKEAAKLRQQGMREAIDTDSDLELLVVWRNHVLKKHTYVTQQPQKRVESAYQKLNKIIMEMSGLLSFKLKYRLDA